MICLHASGAMLTHSRTDHACTSQQRLCPPVSTPLYRAQLCPPLPSASQRQSRAVVGPGHSPSRSPFPSANISATFQHGMDSHTKAIRYCARFCIMSPCCSVWRLRQQRSETLPHTGPFPQANLRKSLTLWQCRTATKTLLGDLQRNSMLNSASASSHSIKETDCHIAGDM